MNYLKRLKYLHSQLPQKLVWTHTVVTKILEIVARKPSTLLLLDCKVQPSNPVQLKRHWGCSVMIKIIIKLILFALVQYMSNLKEKPLIKGFQGLEKSVKNKDFQELQQKFCINGRCTTNNFTVHFFPVLYQKIFIAKSRI